MYNYAAFPSAFQPPPITYYAITTPITLSPAFRVESDPGKIHSAEKNGRKWGRCSH